MTEPEILLGLDASGSVWACPADVLGSVRFQAYRSICESHNMRHDGVRVGVRPTIQAVEPFVRALRTSGFAPVLSRHLEETLKEALP